MCRWDLTKGRSPAPGRPMRHRIGGGPTSAPGWPRAGRDEWHTKGFVAAMPGPSTWVVGFRLLLTRGGGYGRDPPRGVPSGVPPPGGGRSRGDPENRGQQFFLPRKRTQVKFSRPHPRTPPPGGGTDLQKKPGWLRPLNGSYTKEGSGTVLKLYVCMFVCFFWFVGWFGLLFRRSGESLVGLVGREMDVGVVFGKSRNLQTLSFSKHI